MRLRRPVQARLGLPRDGPAPPPAPRPRGVPGRRLLPPQPPARACRAHERRQRRRLPDGPADHRDAGERRVRLHPDERDLDHGRPDLPRDRPVQRRPAARHEHRHLGQPRRLRRADQGDEEGGRPAQAGPRAVPRPRGLRAVRRGPGQGHPGPAEPGREALGDRQAAAVPAAPRGEAGRDPGRGHDRQAGRHPDGPRQGLRDAAVPVPRDRAAGRSSRTSPPARP